MYTNFVGWTRAEKCDFLDKIFQKVPENTDSAAQKNWPKQGFFSA